jgi:Protein of unknown function (DUF3631)
MSSIASLHSKAALRSIINSGHTRGQGVLRCIGEDKVPELFPTFAPKAIGMVGRKLPPATLSRCIFVELRRRKRDEPIEKFTHADDNGLADLRRRLRRCAMDNDEALRRGEPSMPDQLRNRRTDNWKVQLAIADLAGEEWAGKAREAAVKIEGKADSRTDGVRMLADTKAVFEELADDRLPSGVTVQKLTADPEKGWADFNHGKPITQVQLARLLKPFGIYPEPIRVGRHQVRGYVRARFVEAWERYL